MEVELGAIFNWQFLFQFPEALGVGTHFHPIPASGHRAPLGSSRSAVVEEEEIAFGVRASAQAAGELLHHARPSQHHPGGEQFIGRSVEHPMNALMSNLWQQGSLINSSGEAFNGLRLPTNHALKGITHLVQVLKFGARAGTPEPVHQGCARLTIELLSG